MRFPSSEHRLPSIDNRGSAEYVMGMYALIFVMIMALASLQIMQYKADSDIAEDALVASALACLVVDPYIYGENHLLVITDPMDSRNVFENALKENMDLNDAYEPAGGNTSYVKGRVSVDDFRVYQIEGDYVTEYIAGPDKILENRGEYGVMKTPSGKVIRSAGVYARISFNAEGFPGILVPAQKDTYVEMMANPD